MGLFRKKKNELRGVNSFDGFWDDDYNKKRVTKSGNSSDKNNIMNRIKKRGFSIPFFKIKW